MLAHRLRAVKDFARAALARFSPCLSPSRQTDLRNPLESANMGIRSWEAVDVNYFDNPDYVVAVVGAGSGIGKATALHLAEHGVRVACLDRDGETATSTAAEIAKGGGHSVAHHLDVTEDATIPSAIEAVVSAFGWIDALVNCAGITGRASIPGHEVDPADFDLVYRINLRGAFLLSKLVLPTCWRANTAACCMSPRSPARKALPAWPPIPRPRPG